ncbi:DUF6879 family protein [Streptomyces sp. NPDC048361]|uniref:DUF6879 family protein n=1 Tax=Streptomyces sp. NPDC048361 TaxID=3154720 RepID=UPI00343FEFEF
MISARLDTCGLGTRGRAGWRPAAPTRPTVRAPSGSAGGRCGHRGRAVRRLAHHCARADRTGKRFERVRLVDDPPTDGQRYLLASGLGNVDAGEDIRNLVRADAERLGLPDGDFSRGKAWHHAVRTGEFQGRYVPSCDD